MMPAGLPVAGMGFQMKIRAMTAAVIPYVQSACSRRNGPKVFAASAADECAARNLGCLPDRLTSSDPPLPARSASIASLVARESVGRSTSSMRAA